MIVLIPTENLSNDPLFAEELLNIKITSNIYIKKRYTDVYPQFMCLDKRKGFMAKKIRNEKGLVDIEILRLQRFEKKIKTEKEKKKIKPKVGENESLKIII